MCKIWDGDEGEYFTWLDMNRVEYNANAVAVEVGLDAVAFEEVSRASQFRYDEAQKLENLLKAAADKLGIAVTIETAWSYNRTLSYVDFERWESNFWTVYTALGGVGERIPAGKIMVTYSATLFANSWKGKGPYYQDLDVPGIMEGSEVFAFVAHSASVAERTDEYNAVLKAVHLGDKRMRVYALSIKPRGNIPLRFAIGGLEMYKSIELPADSWQGTGPWTQTVQMESMPVNAAIGQQNGMTDEEVIQMMDAKISVSGVGKDSITVRAIGKKPTVALHPGLIWESSEVA